MVDVDVINSSAEDAQPVRVGLPCVTAKGSPRVRQPYNKHCCGTAAAATMPARSGANPVGSARQHPVQLDVCTMMISSTMCCRRAGGSALSCRVEQTAQCEPSCPAVESPCCVMKLAARLARGSCRNPVGTGYLITCREEDKYAGGEQLCAHLAAQCGVGGVHLPGSCGRRLVCRLRLCHVLRLRFIDKPQL